MVCCNINHVLEKTYLRLNSSHLSQSSKKNDLVNYKICDPWKTFDVKSLTGISRQVLCVQRLAKNCKELVHNQEGHGMAFHSSKVKADLKKLTPAPDRPRIFMSNKTSKVVVVFPNGDVVEGRQFLFPKSKRMNFILIR